MNKNLLLLSAIITLLLFTTRDAWAQRFTYTHLGQTLNYEIVDSDAQVVSGYDISGSVTIPETVTFEDNTYNVTSIGHSAFRDCYDLTEIILPFGITSIENYSFYYCKGLIKITLPSSLTDIGLYSFYYCRGLKEITLPDGLISIGEYAFGRSGLTEITFPSGLTSIGNYVLEYCSVLTNIVLPAGLTSIGDGAFRGCNGLKELILPSGLTSIGENAFSSCYNLLDIALPSGLTSLGDYAFSYCRSLIDVALPVGLTYIGDGTFRDCHDLTDIILPSEITSIGSSAFQSCNRLTDIALPIGLESIGSEAFSGCYNLKGITLPAGLTSIGSEAFSGCNRITEIALPAGITSISDGAFQGSGLKEITLHAGITSIGINAFMSCYSLTEIALPSRLTSIGDGAFQNSGLMNITLPAGITNIDNNTFAYCSNLTNIMFPSELTSIGIQAFQNCISLTDISFPSCLTNIGSYAFQNCSGLSEVTLSSGLTSIGNGAFRNCTSLKAIMLQGDTPPSLGSKIFEAAPLARIDVPSASTLTYKTHDDWSVYADLIGVVYTVTFDLQDGNLSDIQEEMISPTVFSAPTIQLRTGYTLAGWYDAPTGGVVVSFPFTITQDTTIYAQWTAKVYSITLNANGGTVYQDNRSVTFNVEVGVLPTPLYFGYEFEGWFTEETGGIHYTDSTVYETDENITLYAQWKEIIIPVESIFIENAMLVLDKDSVGILTAIIIPVIATNQNVIWTSSDSTIVKVDSTGKVTAISPGTAIITVTTVDGDKTATFEVTVVDFGVANENIGATFLKVWSPSSGTIHLSGAIINTIEVYGINGQLLRKLAPNAAEAVLHNLPPGIVVVKVNISGKLYVYKVVIES